MLRWCPVFLLEPKVDFKRCTSVSLTASFRSLNFLQLEFLTAENDDLRKQLRLQEARHALMHREWEQNRESETKQLDDKIELLERANSQLKVKIQTTR